MPKLKKRVLLYAKNNSVLKAQVGTKTIADVVEQGAGYYMKPNAVKSSTNNWYTNFDKSFKEMVSPKTVKKIDPITPKKILKPKTTALRSSYKAPVGVDIKNNLEIKPKTLDTSITKNKSSKPSVSKGMNTASAVVEGVAPIAGAAGSALSNIDDGDNRTYTSKEKTGDIAGSALTGLSTGVGLAGTASSIATAAGGALGAMVIGQTAIPIPIVGAVIGLVVGGIFGKGKAKKQKREAEKNKRRYNIARNKQSAAKNRKENNQQDAEIVNSISSTDSEPAAVQGYMRVGGSFRWTLPKKKDRDNLISNKNLRVFKKGGKIKPSENIIPNGVLHEESNELGDKGMPVIICKKNVCEKKYEIEKDELILTLNTTKKIEELSKQNKLEELGVFIKDQLLNNTHSFTNKYIELNNYKSSNGTVFA